MQGKERQFSRSHRQTGLAKCMRTSERERERERRRKVGISEVVHMSESRAGPPARPRSVCNVLGREDDDEDEEENDDDGRISHSTGLSTLNWTFVFPAKVKQSCLVLGA